jgi:hypothetical protein
MCRCLSVELDSRRIDAVGVPAQVFVDGRRVAGVDYEANRLGERVHGLSSTTREPRADARTCAHASHADGFAYVEFWNFHWPIRYCRDCYTILAGRRPHVQPAEPGPSWTLTVEDVVAAKWANEWPREGRPKRKRTPPQADWPDGY